MCSYLYRRGAVYCTRLVVPTRLRPFIGKSDLGRSLKTKDRIEAKRLLPAWLEEAQSLIAAAERELAKREAPLPIVTPPVHPETQEEADYWAEMDRLNGELNAEDEAKADAENALELRLQRPDAELTTDEATAA